MNGTNLTGTGLSAINPSYAGSDACTRIHDYLISPHCMLHSTLHRKSWRLPSKWREAINMASTREVCTRVLIGIAKNEIRGTKSSDSAHAIARTAKLPTLNHLKCSASWLMSDFGKT